MAEHTDTLAGRTITYAEPELGNVGDSWKDLTGGLTQVKADDVADLVRRGVEVWSYGYGEDPDDGFTTLDVDDLWAFGPYAAPENAALALAVVAEWGPFYADPGQLADIAPTDAYAAVGLPAEWVTREHVNGARFTASPATHAIYAETVRLFGSKVAGDVIPDGLWSSAPHRPTAGIIRAIRDWQESDSAEDVHGLAASGTVWTVRS